MRNFAGEDMKRVLILLLTIVASVAAVALPMDSIRARLERGPVQEKVYLHLDNQCYFVGDTIWYKAYVVRADDLRETDMSRVLYVELVTPDGLVVERQQLIVSPDGYSCGDFEIGDSLYSGYYELRAYTRWMLNFNVSIRDYRRKDKERFYSEKMAEDFFREYGNICSRVIPVYVKPEEEGDWQERGMYQRPKQRADKELKERLLVTFYPEGGNLVVGHRQRVAFEATDEEGQAVSVSGTIGGKEIKTEYMGRGVFDMDVTDEQRKATFTYNGKEYDFDLPKAAEAGVVVRLENGVTIIEGQDSLALAILCRGKLHHFETFYGKCERRISDCNLPTGVNDLLVIDTLGNILADRLFFVNNHDCGGTISVEGLKEEYKPFEQINLTFTCPEVKHFSVSVRDGAMDEPTFDDGNILTDLLLSSELKGFVATPSYYFKKGNERDLDLLMMVQGWRRYDPKPILSAEPLRYRPEGGMTVEGEVYKIGNYISPTIQTTISLLTSDGNNGAFDLSQYESETNLLYSDDEQQSRKPIGAETQTDKGSAEELVALTEEMKRLHRVATDSVNVHGELIVGTDYATVDLVCVDDGHFAFDVPPFYGNAILKLSATGRKWGERKKKRKAKKVTLDDKTVQEYYVRRNLFFPIFAKKYSWYQCHKPMVGSEDIYASDGVSISGIKSVSSMDKRLEELTVKGKRSRRRRKIDFSKPAMVYDVEELSNLTLDYGLGLGYPYIGIFPDLAIHLVLGNYDGLQEITKRLRVVRPTTIQDVPDSAGVSSEKSEYEIYELSNSSDEYFRVKRSEGAMAKDLEMKRLDKLRLFTDFELRNPEKQLERSPNWPDVTLDLVTFPDDGETIAFRDRHIILHGFTAPLDFYHPDYSKKPLPDTKDYRRTLYWEPNAKPDADGHFTATFYNNGEPTRPKVDAAGIGATGKMLYNTK